MDLLTQSMAGASCLLVTWKTRTSATMRKNVLLLKYVLTKKRNATHLWIELSSKEARAIRGQNHKKGPKDNWLIRYKPRIWVLLTYCQCNPYHNHLLQGCETPKVFVFCLSPVTVSADSSLKGSTESFGREPVKPRCMNLNSAIVSLSLCWNLNTCLH